VKPGFLVAAALVLAVLVRRRGKHGLETKALAGLLAAGLAVYGSGVVDLPNVEKLIEDLGQSLGRWTYLLVGALAFLETGAFVGLIAPGEFTIILGGVIAGQGRINIVVLVGLVWACAVAGDCLSFYLGRRLGRGFLERHGPKVKITESRLTAVEAFFERHGGATILIGRFVGLVRAIAPFVAGASKMRFRRFVPFDIVGAGLWGTTFCLLGFVFWRSFDQVANVAGKGAFALGAVIALTAGAVAAYRWLRKPANRAQARVWIARREQEPGWRPFFAVARPVYRRVLAPAGRRVSGPLAFVWRRLVPGEMGLDLTTLLAMVLVGGFAFGGLASLVHHDASLRGDARTFALAADLRSGWLDGVAKVVTHLGELAVVGPIVVVAVVYLVARREVLEGVTVLAGLALTFAGVHITKAAENRPRPADQLVETSGSSFPSGHAAYAIALIAVAVAFRHALGGLASKSALVVTAIVLALAIGATRIYLRAHYMTDVVAGFGLGTAAFSSCALVALIVAFIRHNGRSPA
jgi:membrane protein DedA with SNARE-associated domain/membrane-associated phospholipid phosphatase